MILGHNLITNKALGRVDNTEVFLKIKGVIALIHQRWMQYSYPLSDVLYTDFSRGLGICVTALDDFFANSV